MLSQKECLVFVETLGENRVVPFSAIRTIPSLSWMIPNYQCRHRSEKKKKRNWHLNEPNNKKLAKINEDLYNDMDYLTKPWHIPQQYIECIANPQYGARYSKNDENGGGNNQQNNKNVQTKKQNAAAGDKLMKSENNKNASSKRPVATAEPKPGKTEPQNPEFEPRIHYASQPNMGYTNMDANVVPFQHNMERGDIENPTLVQNFCESIYRMLMLCLFYKDNFLQLPIITHCRFSQ